METNSVQLHRVLTAPPEKLFRAFTDANAMAAWFPPYGYVCHIHSMEVKTGGHYKMSFINFSTGHANAFSGEYLEVIPNEKLSYVNRFDSPDLPGEITTTVRLKAVSCGTEITISQEGIPAVIPTEMCYLGWQDSLDKLKRLVEPNIPDA